MDGRIYVLMCTMNSVGGRIDWWSNSLADENTNLSACSPKHLADVHGILMSEPKLTTCTRLSRVMGISHDSVKRFLLREPYEPKDLFNEAQKMLDLVVS